MRNIVVLLVAAICLAGCATTRTADPYEETNRAIFDFNLQVDQMFLRPTAQRYQNYVPEDVREAIHNCLMNLKAPVTLGNDVLQGEPERAAQTLERFVMNSTFGLGGLFDVATRAGLEEHREDFGQTLAVWGAGEGAYLVLPLLGPSSPRDSAGMAVDFVMDPTIHMRIKQHPWWILGREYITIVDARTRNLEAFDTIERDSLDFYAAVRSLYRQNRANEIRNGMPPE